jgi:hypothetical protein
VRYGLTEMGLCQALRPLSDEDGSEYSWKVGAVPA